MRYPPLVSILILALLGGCAGTRQASVEPASVVAGAAPTVVETPAPVDTATLADSASHGIAVVEVVPAAAPAPTQVAAMPEPFQCMMAWARGAQDALMPWARTVQACEPNSRQP